MRVCACVCMCAFEFNRICFHYPHTLISLPHQMSECFVNRSGALLLEEDFEMDRSMLQPRGLSNSNANAAVAAAVGAQVKS